MQIENNDALRIINVWDKKMHSFIATPYINTNQRHLISSGLTEIEGNTKSEVKLVVRFKF